MSSLTDEELAAIKDRANRAIDNLDENGEAASVAADVLIVLLALKMEKEKSSAPQ